MLVQSFAPAGATPPEARTKSAPVGAVSVGATALKSDAAEVPAGRWRTR